MVATNGLIHVGCMAHACRKFSEAVKAQGKNKKKGKAHQGLALIQKLYRVEKRARQLTPDERYAVSGHSKALFSCPQFHYTVPVTIDISITGVNHDQIPEAPA